MDDHGASPTDEPAPPVLVGRDPLVRQIDALLDAGRPVLCVGPEGVGKSALIAEVARRRNAGRSVAVVDDVDHLGERAIAQLTERLASGEGHILLAGRTDHLPEAALWWWKDELVERLDVAPLAPDDADQLARLLIGGPIEAATRERLRRLTEGNPRLLHGVIEATAAAGAWREVAGLWRLSPRSLAGLRALAAGDWLGDIAPALLGALHVLSVTGELPAAVVDEIATADTTTSVSQALAHAGLVKSPASEDDAEPVCRLASPLGGAIAGAVLDADTQTRLCRAAADALEARGDVVSPAFAHACCAGGRTDPVAADALAAVGELAALENDFDTAERLARPAWERARHPAGGAVLVTAVQRHGRFAEAIALGRDFLATVDAHAHEAPYRQAAWQVAVTLFLDNRHGEALALLDEVAERLGPHHRVFIDALKPRLVLFSGAITDALDESFALRSAIDTTDPDDHVLFAELSYVAAHAALLAGRPVHAQGWSAEAFSLLLSHPDHSAPFNLGEQYLVQVLARAAAGDLTGAQDAIEVVQPMIASLDSPYATGFTRLVLGRVASWRGAEARVAEHLGEAALALVEAQRPGFARIALAGLAGSAARRGHQAEAQRALTELATLPVDGVRMGDATVARELAWVAHLSDQPARAREHLANATALAARSGNTADEAEAWLDQARMGDPSGAARLRALADASQGMLLTSWADGVEALASGAPDPLIDAATTFEAIGADLLAAEWWSAAAAAHGPVPAGRTALRRARALVAEGAQTPLLAAAGTAPELTNRERELAELAASGLGRADIAERLGISARTVDSHLQRVCRKLGVRNRRDLAHVLS